MQWIKRHVLTTISVSLLMVMLLSSLSFLEVQRDVQVEESAVLSVTFDDVIPLYDENDNFMGYFEATPEHTEEDGGRGAFWWWTDPDDCSHKWGYVTTRTRDPYTGRTSIYSNFICERCYTYKNSSWRFVGYA